MAAERHIRFLIDLYFSSIDSQQTWIIKGYNWTFHNKVSKGMAEIPIFKLYGEKSHWWTPDLLHYESIASRSSLHGWEIQPHRHSDLYQLFYVQQGRAELNIEGQVSVYNEGVLQWVAPLCVHGFRFSKDVRGCVLTIASSVVSSFENNMNTPLAFNASALDLEIGRDRQFLDYLFDSLAQEYTRSEPGRELALESWINLLLTWLQRRSIEKNDMTEFRSKGHVSFARFSTLVELHYQEQTSVQRYAQELGVSAVRLNTICHQLCQQTALQFIHQRLLLEAKRNLLYTMMTIASISDRLGFSEQAYFSRFFKRLTGDTPNAFRHAGISQLDEQPFV